jgi:Zn-finger nucleic acid-binding protein
MNCPRCGIVLKIADRQGVEVDFCPTCRGIWLDRGELDKIIERSMRVSGYAKPTRYDDDDYYGDGYDTSPAKRKRGKTYDDDDYYAPHHHPKHKNVNVMTMTINIIGRTRNAIRSTNAATKRKALSKSCSTSSTKPSQAG